MAGLVAQPAYAPLRTLRDVEELERVPLDERVFSWNLNDWIARGCALDPDKPAIQYIADGDPAGTPVTMRYRELKARAKLALFSECDRLSVSLPVICTVIEQLRAKGFWPIVSARLLPVLPFALVNFAAGTARVPFRTFVAASVFGGLPSAILFATLGAGLGASVSARSIGRAAESPMIWGPLAILSILAILPMVLRRRRAG